MTHQVFTTQDEQAWLAELSCFPLLEVFYSPRYHRMHELNGDGAAHLWSYESGGRKFVHCFMKRQIDQVGSVALDQPHFDLESVYGSTGPLSTSDDPAFIEEAWDAFGQWCRSENIVAEFVRFNAVLQNHTSAPAAIKLWQSRDSVAVQLDPCAETMWKNYPSKQRNMLRKAEKAGLICRTGQGEDFDVFRRMYLQTMDYNAAPSYFQYSDAYFAALQKMVQQTGFLLMVEDEGQPVASGAFLAFKNCVTYHLGASEFSARDKAPSNLLLHEAATRAAAMDMQWMHLGAGRTNSPDDSLLRFKASVSRTRLQYYTGTCIHNPTAYQQLCNLWRQQDARPEPPQFFLLYRLPVSSATSSEAA